MKITTLSTAFVALSLSSFSSVWGFTLPAKQATTPTSQLDMSYNRGYYDDYSLGSSFLMENQMNDAYSSQRMFDRNRDDVHFSPYSAMNGPRFLYDDYDRYGRTDGVYRRPYYNSGYYGDYGYGGGYGGYGGYGRGRYSPYYDDDYGYYGRGRGRGMYGYGRGRYSPYYNDGGYYGRGRGGGYYLGGGGGYAYDE